MIDFRSINGRLWSQEPTPFPEALCVTQNEQEPDVLDSDVWFLCACINKRFPHSLELRQLKPYTAKSIDTGEVLYGWVDQFGNYIDHYERSIHLDDEVVVRWVRIESQFSWLEILNLPSG
jgi:hypothetical protein